MDKISQTLLEKLQAWKQTGDRVVKLESDRDENQWGIWIYDYSVSAGIYLRDNDLDQDWDSLILADKRQRLVQELKALDIKLGGVA